MKTLQQQLAEHAASIDVPPGPSYADLADRADRRRRTRHTRLAIAGAGVTALAVTAVAILTLAARPDPSPISGPVNQESVSQGSVSSVSEAAPGRPTAPETTSSPLLATGPSPGPPPKAPTDQQAQAVAADALDKLGATDPLFAGVAFGSGQNAVTVYRKGGAPSDRYPAEVGGVRVAFGNAALTGTEARSTVAAILKARTALKDAGVEVISVGPDIGGPVQVGVKVFQPWMREEVARYAPLGAASITVAEDVEPTPEPLIVPATPSQSAPTSGSGTGR